MVGTFIYPICSICEHQFADDIEYTKHLKDVHGVEPKASDQMDLTANETADAKTLKAQLKAKDKELKALSDESDKKIADLLGDLATKDAAITTITAELEAATESNRDLAQKLADANKK